MALLELFISFFKIGLFTFGGGYAMIPLINYEVITHGWMSEAELINFIGIAESTPGPFAINISTFVGAIEGAKVLSGLGLFGSALGSLLATLGVVLPSFVIILLIATILKRFNENKWVKAFLDGVQPVVIGLIISVGILVIIKSFYINFGDFTSALQIDYVSLIITAGLFVLSALYKKIFKKNLSPILLLLISAIIGIIVF